MEVISYKKCANDLYEVKMDNGEKYKLYEDVIIEYELLIDKNISEVKLKKMLSHNELLGAYHKALKYITTKMRTEKEIRCYLKKNDYSAEAIDYSIKKLYSDGYLNEEKYTQAFIFDAINLSNNGPKKIIDDLTKLGIGIDTISKYLNHDRDFWMDRIFNITSKYAKKNKASAFVFKNKMFKQMLMLGYETDDIKYILDDFKIDNRDALTNEARKIWKHLEKETDNDKKIWQFRNKMYAKGYSTDEINNYIEKEII